MIISNFAVKFVRSHCFVEIIAMKYLKILIALCRSFLQSYCRFLCSEWERQYHKQINIGFTLIVNTGSLG